jgi:hypothetical protein
VAQQPTSKGGTSRIRFIMLDAEIPEGDLSQITAAIQNALKPTTTIIQQRLPSTQASAALPNGSQDTEVEIEGESLELEEEAQPEATDPRSAREPKARKLPSMKVLVDSI